MRKLRDKKVFNGFKDEDCRVAKTLKELQRGLKNMITKDSMARGLEEAAAWSTFSMDGMRSSRRETDEVVQTRTRRCGSSD